MKSCDSRIFPGPNYRLPGRQAFLFRSHHFLWKLNICSSSLHSQNNIEHLWGPVTQRLANVILYPGGRDGAAKEGEEGAKQQQVGKGKKRRTQETDADIETVKGLLTDFTFASFPVVPVALKCNSDEVQVGDQIVDQGKFYHELKGWKQFFHGNRLTKSRMHASDESERKKRALLTWVCKHMDKRAHR